MGLGAPASVGDVSSATLPYVHSAEAHSSRVYIVDFGLAKSHAAAVSTLALFV